MWLFLLQWLHIIDMGAVEFMLLDNPDYAVCHSSLPCNGHLPGSEAVPRSPRHRPHCECNFHDDEFSFCLSISLYFVCLCCMGFLYAVCLHGLNQ